MGMNYYIKNGESEYHIAKTSKGCPMLFQAHHTPEHWPSLKSLRDIMHYVKMRGYKIINEAGITFSPEEFMEIVNMKNHEKTQESKHYRHETDVNKCFQDKEGNLFTYEDFS